MNCPAENQAYIYHGTQDSHFSVNRIESTGSYRGENVRFYYYEASPDTAISGVRLAVRNVSKVRLYKGEYEATGEPISESSDSPHLAEIDTTGEVILAFDKTTFGAVHADRLLIGLVQDGTADPEIDDISYYGTMIAFPDGFFDKIVPTRMDRGGGTIELADGTLVQYKGFGGNRWRWKLGAKFVDKQMLDRLDALYAQRPEFFFAQEPNRYPNRIYRCILENPIFSIPYTTQWKGNGYSIEMDIAQV